MMLDPAFPLDPIDGPSHAGMSLRDYFAAQALAGMLANHTLDQPPRELAEFAYMVADAMLAERAK